MVEPAKPFACSIPDCGMTFTNEDHLHVHTKKHDMILQLGAEQRANFVADQTPTPTRFIRNCEEVGLFQDLQNVTVNPFDEGFKRAMETKQGVLSLESTLTNDDVLHTPQMVFPALEGPAVCTSLSDESSTLKQYKTTTISKLTNEVSTISRVAGNRDAIDKISDDVIKTSQLQTKDTIETVYKNIKIHSNVEIRKNNVNIVETDSSNKIPVLIYTDTVIKDSVVTKDVLLTDNSKLTVDKIPIMSQKSLDLVVDSLTSELNSDLGDKSVNDKDDVICVDKLGDDNETALNSNKEDHYRCTKDGFSRSKTENCNLKAKKLKKTNLDTNKIVNINLGDNRKRDNEKDDIEVIIKLPDGKKVHMKAVEDSKTDTKEVLRKTIESKKKANEILTSIVPNILPMPGTLIPVTLLNTTITPIPVTNNVIIPKVPISLNPNVIRVSNINEFAINNSNNNKIKSQVTKFYNKRKLNRSNKFETVNLNVKDKTKEIEERLQASSSNVFEENEKCDEDDDCVIEKVTVNSEVAKRARFELDSRCAASKRYRARLKDSMKKQSEENRRLTDINQMLIGENALLKLLITEHMKRCPNADDLRVTQERLKNGNEEF